MASVSAAAKSAPKVLPPPSTFGELLRRSKFAAYDPSIRQAYSAPASYTHRGNWGLKRPIANRSRRGAIVLRKFEEHAQFIEWDRAEHQVKVIRSVEEMGVSPTLVPQTSWFTGLGQAATSIETGFDSDFCPGEDTMFPRVEDERYAEDVRPRVSNPNRFKKDEPEWEAIVPASAPGLGHSVSDQDYVVEQLRSLGNRGKGEYGSKGDLKTKEGDEALLRPNIHAMTPVEFQRYIESLRELRPEFLKYMREQLQLDWENNFRCYTQEDPSTVKDEDLVFTFASEATMKFLHMGFLGRYTNEHMFKEDATGPEAIAKGEGEDIEGEVKIEAEEVLTEEEVKTKTVLEEEAEEADRLQAFLEDTVNRPSPIRKQPHKLGGLMYARPTALESFFSVKPASGLILQEAPHKSDAHVKHDGAEWIAAFGGLTSRLNKTNAPNVKPLYSAPKDGLVAPRLPDPERPGKWTFYTRPSEAQMRVISLELEDTPQVVGENVSNKPLLTTRLRSRVVVPSAISDTFRDNPFLPGSRDYINLETPEFRLGYGSVSKSSNAMTTLARRMLDAKAKPQSGTVGALPTSTGSVLPTVKAASRDNLLSSLQSMLRTKGSNYPSASAGFKRGEMSKEVVEDETKEN